MIKWRSHYSWIVWILCISFMGYILSACSKTPHVFKVIQKPKSEISLPAPSENANWAMAYENINGALKNYYYKGDLKKIWRANIGSGADSDERLINPVIYGNTVFAVNSDYEITAVNFKTGKRLWRFEPTLPDESSGDFGGGLAFYNGILYMATGFGHVFAFDTINHKLLWNKDYKYPFRSPPTVSNNHLYIEQDGDRLISIDGSTGKVLWTHESFGSLMKILGGSAPTVHSNIIFFGNSQGNVLGLSSLNGQQLVSVNVKSLETMFSLHSKPLMPYNFFNSIRDIHSPIVLTTASFLADSVTGNLSSINNSSVVPNWSLGLGSYNTILYIDTMVYALDTARVLWAISMDSGKVVWKTSLPAWDNAKKRKDAVVWSGPIMAGNRLWLTSSDGEIIGIDAKTGSLKIKKKYSEVFLQNPIFAKGYMFLVSEDGYLYKFS